MSIMVHRLVFPNGLDGSPLCCTLWGQSRGRLDERLSFFFLVHYKCYVEYRGYAALYIQIGRRNATRVGNMIASLAHVRQSTILPLNTKRLIYQDASDMLPPSPSRCVVTHALLLHATPFCAVIDRSTRKDVPHQTSRASDWV
jgi:hypothetical protein